MQNRLWPFWSKEVEETVLNRIRMGDIYATEIDPIIEKFESDFETICCPGKKVIFCNTGTSGLLAAYFALKLDPGSEVLVPTNTFRATVTPLLTLGLSPVFCDCDYNTGLINLDDVERRITSKTQALVVTHMWGHPVNMERATALASKYGLALVEDCSHAHGAKWNNKHVGTFGDVAVFSLGTKKMVSGGIGGAIATSNQQIYERATLLCQPKPWADARINNEALRKYISSGIGFNLRGSPISAILAADHLHRLGNTIKIKNNNFSLLDKLIDKYLPDLKTPERCEGFTDGTWYSYQCRWEHPTIERDKVLSLLQEYGLSADKPSGLLHEQEIFNQPENMFHYFNFNKKNTEQEEYKEGKRLMHNIIGWDTRDLYEPAEGILKKYENALKRVAYEIYES